MDCRSPLLHFSRTIAGYARPYLELPAKKETIYVPENHVADQLVCPSVIYIPCPSRKARVEQTQLWIRAARSQVVHLGAFSAP
jgi:hypothetical protein